MTVEYSGKDIGMVAAEDLSARQFCYVHQATDNTVDLLDSTSELPFGILQNAPEDGETAVVRIEGTSKLVMNAAVAVATYVKAEYVGAADNGKGDAADTDRDVVSGQVIKASGAEDDVGAVIITRFTLSSA